MRASVRDRDHGARRLASHLEDLERNGAVVTVGVHRDTGATIHRGSRSPQTVGEVALAQELSERRGARGRMVRGSWLRRSVDRLRPRLQAELREAAADVLMGSTVRHAFGRVGRILLESCQRLVAVDTGQLRDSMQVRVRGERV